MIKNEKHISVLLIFIQKKKEREAFKHDTHRIISGIIWDKYDDSTDFCTKENPCNCT